MILQANISGYAGRASTVIAHLDIDSEILTIIQANKMITKRYTSEDGEESGVVSNNIGENCDFFFNEENFKDAFKTYRTLDSSKKIIFSKKAQNIKPKIEIDKISETGTSFLVSADTTNDHVAVLALSLYARHALDTEIALSLNDDLDLFTI